MLPSFFIGETTLFIHFFCGVFYNLYFCASIDETKINTYDEEFENKEITVYDLNGIRVHDTENITRGIYIINGKKVLVK